jgi:predicted alpha/beta superfamily hydrolase
MTSEIAVIADFHSVILNNERNLYIYLPPSYQTALETRYPVLYMHDGQHVFSQDCYGDSWEVQHTVDRLVQEAKMKEIIVIAVSSISNARIAEYVHDHPAARTAFHTVPSGEAYEAFLIDEVKAYIDKTYRTQPEQEHTAIMGSSAGGLVSYHIGFRRPDIFGFVGILSPFFVHSYMDGLQLSETPIYQSYNQHPPIRCWLDMGGAEGLMTVGHARGVAEELIDCGFIPGEDLFFYMDPDSGHTQQAWANRMELPLLLCFGTVGRPKNMELLGSKQVGIGGALGQLYANVEYGSGFRMSLLRAQYRVANGEIVDVDPDGTIRPKRTGSTEIQVVFDGLQAAIHVEVIPELPNTVTVEVTVDVPAGTKQEERIYAGFEIPRTGDGVYHGTFHLPRDLTFAVKVSKGFGLNEKRQELRRFTTAQGLSLHYRVEEWETN